MTQAPASPEPDAKDWTWVLDRPCPDCGFVAASLAGPEVAPMLRDSAGRWQVVLTAAGSGADIRRRPAPSVWSTLEYGAHCRDVYLVFQARLRLLLDQHDPVFPNWDQDATALEKRYWESDPAVVVTELMAAAESAAATFEGVSGEQWSRTGRRSNGSVFTVQSLGQYMVHDLVHHLHDVGAT